MGTMSWEPHPAHASVLLARSAAHLKASALSSISPSPHLNDGVAHASCFLAEHTVLQRMVHNHIGHFLQVHSSWIWRQRREGSLRPLPTHIYLHQLQPGEALMPRYRFLKRRGTRGDRPSEAQKRVPWSCVSRHLPQHQVEDSKSAVSVSGKVSTNPHTPPAEQATRGLGLGLGWARDGHCVS